jgi:hypothetical protein
VAPQGIGQLRQADESLTHQIVDTFDRVSESDRAWTEKIWGSFSAADGSLQASFGLGKYHNRGIIDGFGGISRGPEQWTVRASRELSSAPEETAVGPLRYEVLDALKAIRFVLEPNEIQPISYDVTLFGVTPPFFEDRNHVRDPRTGRVEVDVIRYHQGGWVSGSVTVDGETTTIDHEEWFGFRDHSWGVRHGVGEQPKDTIGTSAAQRKPGRGNMKWSPCFLRRPDGSYYETALFVSSAWRDFSSAYLNEADTEQIHVESIEPKIAYDPRTRYVRGGEMILHLDSGEKRVLEIEALGSSGFFLRTAGYGAWAGAIHGSWRGPLHLDGEYIPDCWADQYLDVLGQFRDTPIRVREGDAVGFGVMESIISGVWPELGLTEDSDHFVSYA